MSTSFEFLIGQDRPELREKELAALGVLFGVCNFLLPANLCSNTVRT